MNTDLFEMFICCNKKVKKKKKMFPAVPQPCFHMFFTFLVVSSDLDIHTHLHTGIIFFYTLCCIYKLS